LALGELLSLVYEFPCLDKPIKLDSLLARVLELCVHYLINGCILHAYMVEICWFQLFCGL
jgi:hypothetical protein